MKSQIHLAVCLYMLVPVFLVAGPLTGSVDDWPQLQYDAARSGCHPRGPVPPYKAAWKRRVEDFFAEEAQPIVASGRVLAGSLRGVFYCFDGADGKTLWTFDAGAPVAHSAAAENGRVFFSSRNGKIYCLDVETGAKAWECATGRSFYAAPALTAGKLLIGNSGGEFYAISQSDGAVAWKQDIGQPILQSAASDGARVYFGDESMMFHALDVSSGGHAWSNQVWGETFYGTHPVVTGGKAMTMTFSPRAATPRTEDGVFRQKLEPIFQYYHHDPWRPDFLEGLRKEQEDAAAIYAERPKLRTFYVMNAETGQEPYVPAVTACGANNGVQAAPVVCADGDSVFLTYSPNCPYTRMAFITLGRFDLETGLVAETLIMGYHGDTPKDIPFDWKKFSLWGRASWWATYDPATGEPIDMLNSWVGDESTYLTAVPGWVIAAGDAGDADCVETGPERRGYRVDPNILYVGSNEWRFYAVPAGEYMYSLESYATGSTLCAVVHDPDWKEESNGK